MTILFRQLWTKHPQVALTVHRVLGEDAPKQRRRRQSASYEPIPDNLHLIAFLLLVASLLLVVRPGAPNSVLATFVASCY